MKSPKYLKWIREQDCCVSGTPAFGWEQVQAHHVILAANRGLSQKTSDYTCVPLRADLHMMLHDMGPGRFWESRGLNPYQIALNLLIRYLEESS